MCLRALLLAAVLFCSESSVHGSPEKVCVSAGGVVILPCSFPPNDVFRTLEWSKTEWSKTDQEKVIVFLFRDNREDLVEQSPLYVSRTNLVEDLKSGNASLRISNIQAADEGTYQCMRMWNKDQQNITEVELSVVGGFTLECEATSVGSDAEITFLDENGKNLSADDPKKNVSRGCYTVQRRVTLQEAASRVTCRVQRADTNETRETQIQLPVEEPKSCSHTAVYTVLVTVAVTVLVTVAVTVLVIVFVLRYRSALVFSLLKKYCKTESSGESATNGAEHLGLLDVRVENKNTKNATIEKLQTEVADLKSKLNQKNQTICKLQRTNTKLTKKNWTKSQEMEKTIGNLQNNTNPQPLEADDSPPEEGNLSNDSDLPLLRQRQFCSL